MNLEISTEIKPDVVTLSTNPCVPRSLVLEQSLQWRQILRGFERGDYAPKRSLTNSVRSLCDRFPVSGRRILDAGCGTGLVGLEFARCGADIFGIDILPFAVDQAVKRFPTALGDVCSYRHNRLFGAALCSMVLMLVDDIAGAVRNLSSQIAPEGYLYAAILNPGLTLESCSRRSPYSETAVWQFCVDEGLIEIDYFSRTLDEYLFCLDQEFTIEFISAVTPTGELLSVTPDATVKSGGECLWIVARKRSLAKGNATVLEVHNELR